MTWSLSYSLSPTMSSLPSFLVLTLMFLFPLRADAVRAPPHIILTFTSMLQRLLTADTCESFFWSWEMLGLSSGPARSAIKLMFWKQL